MAPPPTEPESAYVQASDGLGYFLMSLATWFASPIFAADSQRWVRRSFMRLPVLALVREGMSMCSGGRFPDLLRPFNRVPNIYGIRAFESCRARQCHV
jgi:hypothetical protein